MSSHIFLKHSHKFLTKKLESVSILLNKCEGFSNSAVNRQLKRSEHNKQADMNQNLLFPENKHKTNERADTISKAMLYYLEKLNEREELLKIKTEEFEIGKRHLAKMMGENPDTFNQADIDRAIEYLLPSGLFVKQARPFLKHPEKYYPKSNVAKFTKDGRPISHLFYTGKPELYQLTYEATQKLINLKRLEDSMHMIREKVVSKSKLNEATSKIDLSGTVWIKCSDLANKLNIKIDEYEFEKYLTLLKKLADHPLSKREEPFLKEFLCPFVPPIKMSDILEPLKDHENRAYQEISTSLRTATVKLKLIEGTGKVRIFGPEGEFDISFFKELTHRQQVLFPFKVVDRLNKFDMEVEVNKGGMSCLAKALRYSISKGLCSFVSSENIEKLRLAGLLTKDLRYKERKKYGKEGARRAYTWKKR